MSSNKLSSRGYVVHKSTISTEELQKVKDILTTSPYTPFAIDDARKITFVNYRESSNKIYLPKSFGLKRYGLPSVNEIENGKNICAVFEGTLRDYQKIPVDTFIEAALDPLKKGGILQLPPGAGKTVMALNIISRLKKKTLIIVHKSFLQEQWKERIAQYLSNVSVGIIRQSKVETNNDIVIASLQSIAMRDYDKAVFSGFGLVIIDECHHTAAQVFSQAFYKTNFQFSLGLSATVQRKDGLTKVFKWFIGDIIYKAKTKTSGSVKVIINHYFDECPSYSAVPHLFNGKINMAQLINKICAYGPRTDLIIQVLLSVLKKEPDRNVIVLSDRKAHLQDIKEKLNDNDLYDIGFYTGGMKQSDLQFSESKQIILGTYSMVSEGFDLPKLNTLVLASPKSDVEQSVGRIQRQLANERQYEPVVIDIVDELSILARQGQKRKQFYVSKAFEIVEIGKLKSTPEIPKFAFKLDES